MPIGELPQLPLHTETSAHLSGADTQSSANLVAETLTPPELVPGSAPPGSEATDAESFEELLPLSQRMSKVMVAAHISIRDKFGAHLATLTLAESQALTTQLMQHEKQLLTTSDPAALFSDIQPLQLDSEDPPGTTSDPGKRLSGSADDGPHEKLPRHEHRLSLLEYTQIRQDNSHLSDVVCVRATADLVKTLRQPTNPVEIPGRSQGKTSLAAATSFVASALRLTYSAVDKRVTAAATMWPDMKYRRSTTVTPRLAAQLEQGRVPLASAVAAQDKLARMRQAVRRAGGDEAVADDLVRHKEKEFVHHALRNNPHTFGRFAKAQSDAVTNELIGPAQTLTSEQTKYEKGIFYDAPIGDTLHRLTLVVDDGELLQLTAIREFSTKLDSVISTLRSQAHDDSQEQSGAPIDPSDKRPVEDDPAENPRLAHEDIELGIGKLFDGQTKAERWLNTLLDFTSAALMLHKTYDPHATAEEQHRRDVALRKAADHSDLLSDILEVSEPPDRSHGPPGLPQTHPSTSSENSPPDEALHVFVPPGYQLLRPNVDLIVEISLRDLVGSPRHTEEPNASETSGSGFSKDSELYKILEQLKHDGHGLTTPRGSPGNVRVDYDLARQQACHQRIIPMVLGTASQPLDVGRAQRSFSSAMRRALHVRDRGCVVPGCPRPPSWCEPHHLEEWANGGSTSVENGVLLCRQHHSAVHKNLLQVHMEADGRPSCSLPSNQDPTQTRYRNVFWLS